jgi:hypothetical protein
LKRIQAFALTDEERQDILVGGFLRVLSLEDRTGTVIMHVMTDVSRENQFRKIHLGVFETGKTIEESAITDTFVGSVVQYGGNKVKHVFILGYGWNEEV